MAEDMVLTPGGLRPKSLVHLIEPGHVLDRTAGHLRKLDPSGQVVADFGPTQVEAFGSSFMHTMLVSPA